MSRNQMPRINPLPVEPPRVDGVEDILGIWLPSDTNLNSSDWFEAGPSFVQVMVPNSIHQSRSLQDVWAGTVASESNLTDQQHESTHELNYLYSANVHHESYPSVPPQPLLPSSEIASSNIRAPPSSHDIPSDAPYERPLAVERNSTAESSLVRRKPQLRCFTCGKSVNRKADLDRHIREQHHCLSPDCQTYIFSIQEQQEHMKRSHYGRYPGFFNCGSCEVHGLAKNVFKRREKFEAHLSQHGISEPVRHDQFQCTLFPCCDSRIPEGGLFFATQDDLNIHLRDDHSMIEPRDTIGPSGDCKRTGHLVKNNFLQKSSKRSLDLSIDLSAKRLRPGISTEDSSSIIDERVAITSTDEVAPVRFDTPTQSHLAASRPSSVLSIDGQVGCEIPLTLLGLLALNKRYDFKQAINQLHKDKISTTFDTHKGVILLKGSRAEVERRKNTLEAIIAVRVPKLSVQLYQPKTHLKALKKMAYQSYFSNTDTSTFFSVDVEEDGSEIATWSKYILPQLDGIVEGLPIGDTWSAILVRQPNDDGTLVPVIRFCSSENQSLTIRNKIQRGITAICEHNRCTSIEVCFSVGTTHYLVGGHSSDSPPNDEVPFPHFRRHWQRPGMGASIGIGNCGCVSASTGGHILANGCPYLLSVSHFVYPKHYCSCADLKDSVSSPSLADLHYMRGKTAQKLEELQYKISESGPRFVDVLSAKEDLLQPNDTKLLGLYQEWDSVLTEPDEYFKLGTIAYTSNHNIVQESTIRYPDLGIVKHRMDWALIQVNTSREGRNAHRYKRCHRLSIDDLSNEKLTPLGAGMLCQRTTGPQGGLPAYYVGSTSGFREGTINAVPAKIKSRDGLITVEWAMFVSGCNTKDPKLFGGDSGAWILDNTNSVIGMLWGWTDGYLVFTPIQAIFADIRSSIPNCDDEPELLPDDPYTDHAVTPLTGGYHCDQQEKDLIACTPLPFHQIEPSKAMPKLLEILVEEAIESDTSNTSLSLVPSLASSRSSSPEISIPSSPALLLHSNINDDRKKRNGNQAQAMDIRYIVAIDDEDVRLRRKVADLPLIFSLDSANPAIETC